MLTVPTDEKYAHLIFISWKGATKIDCTKDIGLILTTMWIFFSNTSWEKSYVSGDLVLSKHPQYFLCNIFCYTRFVIRHNWTVNKSWSFIRNPFPLLAGRIGQALEVLCSSCKSMIAPQSLGWGNKEEVNIPNTHNWEAGGTQWFLGQVVLI